MFLVDPFKTKVVSTDKVLLQQQDWWVGSIFAEKSDEKEDYTSELVDSGANLVSFMKRPHTFVTLPAELRSQIISLIEWPMPLAAAKEVRVKLMAERSKAAVNSCDESGVAWAH